MSNWRNAKNYKHKPNKCPKCHADYPDDEYSFDDDHCLYCLFPEASRSMPAPISHDKGYAQNVTDERELLDNLDNTPEKQSKQANDSYKEYQNRKAYK